MSSANGDTPGVGARCWSEEVGHSSRQDWLDACVRRDDTLEAQAEADFQVWVLEPEAGVLQSNCVEQEDSGSRNHHPNVMEDGVSESYGSIFGSASAHQIQLVETMTTNMVIGGEQVFQERMIGFRSRRIHPLAVLHGIIEATQQVMINTLRNAYVEYGVANGEPQTPNVLTEGDRAQRRKRDREVLHDELLGRTFRPLEPESESDKDAELRTQIHGSHSGDRVQGVHKADEAETDPISHTRFDTGGDIDPDQQTSSDEETEPDYDAGFKYDFISADEVEGGQWSEIDIAATDDTTAMVDDAGAVFTTRVQASTATSPRPQSSTRASARSLSVQRNSNQRSPSAAQSMANISYRGGLSSSTTTTPTKRSAQDAFADGNGNDIASEVQTRKRSRGRY